MFIALITFHVLVCLALILVVLLQSSKGEGLAGSAFGGGGGISGAVFGGRGAGTFLSKATTVLAVVFMVNCVALAFLSSSRASRSAAAASEDATSVVTREAQAERDRALQQQQQQQQQTGDTSGGTLNLNVSPSQQSGDKPSSGAQEPATTGDGN